MPFNPAIDRIDKESSAGQPRYGQYADFNTAGQASKIKRVLTTADMVIGAVLIPGAAAPKLVSREMLSGMKSGAVLVDVAIDQGGCFETSRATTHAEPTYEVEGIIHYCVANMPGAVPRTSTTASGWVRSGKTWK